MGDFDCGGSFSGQEINESTAMRVSTVYGCVSLIAGAISSMSTPIYERTATGRKKAESHEYWWLLNEQSNKEITACKALFKALQTVFFIMK